MQTSISYVLHDTFVKNNQYKIHLIDTTFKSPIALNSDKTFLRNAS